VKVWRYRDGGPGTQPRIAVGAGDGPPVDLVRAWTEVTGGLEGDLGPFLTSTLKLIEGGRELWRDVAQVARAASGMSELEVEESDPLLKWLCPLDVVPSLRDFLAFEDHVMRGAERRGTTVPDYWYTAPVYYKGNHRAIIGPDDVCPWPSYTEQLDFELEMAMIVGKKGRDISREKAGDHIFGFTIMNDFSARDIQAKEMSAWLGPAKGKDFATALGPCIVTADEIGAEPDLEMVCRVNGEEWGRARSSQAHWRWADMIAHVSAAEDIYPGDVYGSGTPGGCCGVDVDRQLSPGDVVELELEKVGILSNLMRTSTPT
jgi:2-keto-4-pentenoate hydratase/2-oxohepta-3-ene-1,7-dioic acid hydratase in catechol pathway